MKKEYNYLTDYEVVSDGFPSLLRLCVVSVVDNIADLEVSDFDYISPDVKELLFCEVLGRDGVLDKKALVPFLDADIREVDLSYRSLSSVEGLLSHVKQCCPNLSVISLQNVTAVRDLIPTMIFNSFPFLTSINLSYCHSVSAKTITAIPSLPHLTSLMLNGVISVDSVCLRAIAKSCPALEALGIALSRKVRDDGLQALESLQQLRYLNMCGCNRTTEAAWLSFAAKGSREIAHLNLSDILLTIEGYIRIASLLPKLDSLLLGRMEDYRLPSLPETEFCQFVDCVPRLIAVDCSGWGLQEAQIKYLVESCPDLQVLILRNTRLTLKGFEYIARLCTKLRVFDFKSFDSYGKEYTAVWREIAQNNKQLAVLNTGFTNTAGSSILMSVHQ